MSALDELRTRATNAAVIELRDTIAKLPKSREASIAQTHLDTAMIVQEVYGYSAFVEISMQLQLCKAWLAYAPVFVEASTT